MIKAPPSPPKPGDLYKYTLPSYEEPFDLFQQAVHVDGARKGREWQLSERLDDHRHGHGRTLPDIEVRVGGVVMFLGSTTLNHANHDETCPVFLYGNFVCITNWSWWKTYFVRVTQAMTP